MYKNIIFSLYGTLIDIMTNEISEDSWSRLSMFFSYNGALYTGGELRQCYSDIMESKLNENKNTEYPDIKIGLILKLLYEKKGVGADDKLLEHTAELFRIESTAQINLYSNIKGLLGTLSSRRMRLFVLFNGQKEFAISEMKYLQVINYFEAVYSSSEIGVRMPDKAAYTYIMENKNLRAGECLFVSNSLSAIKGAKEASMDTVYIQNSPLGNAEKSWASYEILDGDITQLLKYAY